ncbi:unnamed protein product [Moneuplotes crassus]|uniref:Uncharacterized protein n=1 Tax=Euplotes crassus TaxID=5936 RepID=A0AAD1XHR7_EUPCR|nr:unnamed protein product [Moneuplotes crassus]
MKKKLHRGLRPVDCRKFPKSSQVSRKNSLNQESTELPVGSHECKNQDISADNMRNSVGVPALGSKTLGSKPKTSETKRDFTHKNLSCKSNLLQKASKDTFSSHNEIPRLNFADTSTKNPENFFSKSKTEFGSTKNLQKYLNPQNFELTAHQKKWDVKTTSKGCIYYQQKGHSKCQWEIPRVYDATSRKYKPIFNKHWKKGKDPHTGKKLWRNINTDVTQTVDPFGKTYIFEAAVKGNLAFLELYCQYGGNINLFDKQKRTPLHHACANGNLSFIKSLISLGAHINKRDNTKMTPIFHAVKYHYKECLKVLIEAGADLKVAKANGDTLIHEAATYDSADCLIELAQHNLPLNGKNNIQKTPLSLAKGKKSKNAYKALMELQNTTKSTNSFLGKKHLKKASEKFRPLNLKSSFKKSKPSAFSKKKVRIALEQLAGVYKDQKKEDISEDLKSGVLERLNKLATLRTHLSSSSEINDFAQYASKALKDDKIDQDSLVMQILEYEKEEIKKVEKLLHLAHQEDQEESKDPQEESKEVLQKNDKIGNLDLLNKDLLEIEDKETLLPKDKCTESKETTEIKQNDDQDAQPPQGHDLDEATIEENKDLNTEEINNLADDPTLKPHLCEEIKDVHNDSLISKEKTSEPTDILKAKVEIEENLVQESERKGEIKELSSVSKDIPDESDIEDDLDFSSHNRSFEKHPLEESHDSETTEEEVGLEIVERKESKKIRNKSTEPIGRSHIYIDANSYARQGAQKCTKFYQTLSQFLSQKYQNFQQFLTTQPQRTPKTPISSLSSHKLPQRPISTLIASKISTLKHKSLQLNPPWPQTCTQEPADFPVPSQAETKDFTEGFLNYEEIVDQVKDFDRFLYGENREFRWDERAQRRVKRMIRGGRGKEEKKGEKKGDGFKKVLEVVYGSSDGSFEEPDPQEIQESIAEFEKQTLVAQSEDLVKKMQQTVENARICLSKGDYSNLIFDSMNLVKKEQTVPEESVEARIEKDLNVLINEDFLEPPSPNRVEHEESKNVRETLEDELNELYANRDEDIFELNSEEFGVHKPNSISHNHSFEPETEDKIQRKTFGIYEDEEYLHQYSSKTLIFPFKKVFQKEVHRNSDNSLRKQSVEKEVCESQQRIADASFTKRPSSADICNSSSQPRRMKAIDLNQKLEPIKKHEAKLRKYSADDFIKE